MPLGLLLGQRGPVVPTAPRHVPRGWLVIFHDVLCLLGLLSCLLCLLFLFLCSEEEGIAKASALSIDQPALVLYNLFFVLFHPF